MTTMTEPTTRSLDVAGAMDWPGLDRWGTSEDDALGWAISVSPPPEGSKGDSVPVDSVDLVMPLPHHASRIWRLPWPRSCYFITLRG